MERINKILKHADFQKHIAKNNMAEAQRRFCHHDMGHFLDVARIAMILNEKEQLGISEEWIYAAALLHDIGRWKQYEDGTRHEVASYEFAPKILEEVGFEETERVAILSAILEHRNSEKTEEASFDGLLYRADKMSRSCFACEMESECNWKAEKKNMRLIF